MEPSDSQTLFLYLVSRIIEHDMQIIIWNNDEPRFQKDTSKRVSQNKFWATAFALKYLSNWSLFWNCLMMS